MTEPAVQDTPVAFSEAVRKATWNMHGAAQHSQFMGELFSGTLPRERYVRLVEQYYFIYSALERAGETMRADAVAAPFVRDELARKASLAVDLTTFLGEGWEAGLSAIPATQAYCDRLEAVCFDWPGGFIAHHYVRYMGDLSGGQAIRKAVARNFGFEGAFGTAFYQFDGISDADAFKQGYRAQLDAAPWEAEERGRVIDEILRAYDLNTTLLNSL